MIYISTLGDFGVNFYIIIRGSVYVLIKPTKIQTEKPVKRDESDENEYRIDVEPVSPTKEQIDKFWKENKTERERKEILEKSFPDFVLAKEMSKGESFGEIALNVLGDRFLKYSSLVNDLQKENGNSCL